MPPIAEDMAGGNTQQQQPAPKKKGLRSPRGSLRDTPSTTKQKQQVPEQQTPHQLLTLRGENYQDDSAGSASSIASPEYTNFNDDNAEESLSQLQMKVTPPRRVTLTKMDQYSTDTNLATEFFKKEPCLYSHRMFIRASKIFDSLKKIHEAKMERRKMGGGAGMPVAEMEVEQLDFKNAKEQKLTYELAFATLKFEIIFDEMLEDCGFFTIYPELKDEECLVLVVLWDYQSRKFQPRIQFDANELTKEITKIERAILDQKTKLGASLARRRIKEAAPTIDYLLPDKLRNKPTAQKPLPLNAWVNTIKISPAELLMKLKEEKFCQLWTAPKVPGDWQEKSFHLDPYCSDLLVFSPDCNTVLQEHYLLEQGYMVRQDKSSCLAAHSVVHLLGDEQDVVVINPGAGMTAAHLALLLKDRKGSVVVISEHHEDDFNKMMRNLELIGVTQYTRVLREKFVDMDPDDLRLKSVRAALVTADCSKSAVSNIVNYIVTEGENLKLLHDLSDQSEDMDDQMNQLQTKHVAVLRQALKLTRIQGVTYLTRSVHDQENDAVVQRAIEYVNMVQMARKLRPWRVIPPVLPFSAEEIDEQVGIEGKNACFKPSEFMNGCFIVCIAREPEDPAETASRVRDQKAVGGKSSKTKLKTSGSSSGSSETGSKPRKKSLVKKSKPNKVSSASPTTSGSSTNGSPTPSRQSREKVPEHVRVVKHPAPFR